MTSTAIWIDTEEEGDVCAICIDPYDDPITLICLHSYCRECAKLLVKKNPTTSTFFIPCPLCETETDLGRDERLKKVRTNKKLRKQSQRKKGKKVDTEQDVDEDYIRMMNQLKTDEAVMPRNIKLLLEYDASIGKEGKSFIPDSHNGMISYGTEETANDSSESSLTNWHAMIIGPQESPIGQVIYFLKVIVPKEYPKIPPEVKFVSPKVVMDCVDPSGKV